MDQIRQIVKRDGRTVDFNVDKIADAIYRNLVKECFSEIFALQQILNKENSLYGKGLHKKYS